MYVMCTGIPQCVFMFLRIRVCALVSCSHPKGGFHFQTFMSHSGCTGLLQAGWQIFTKVSERFIFCQKSGRAGVIPFVCQSPRVRHSKKVHLRNFKVHCVLFSPPKGMPPVTHVKPKRVISFLFLSASSLLSLDALERSGADKPY